MLLSSAKPYEKYGVGEITMLGDMDYGIGYRFYNGRDIDAHAPPPMTYEEFFTNISKGFFIFIPQPAFMTEYLNDEEKDV